MTNPHLFKLIIQNKNSGLRINAIARKASNLQTITLENNVKSITFQLIPVFSPVLGTLLNLIVKNS